MFISQLGSSKPTNVLPNFNFDDYTSLSNCAWSPNERYLALLMEANLSIWDTSNGKQSSLNGNNSSSQSNIVAFAWATDSKSITAVDDQNNISQWPVE